jgi:hypothetical protein
MVKYGMELCRMAGLGRSYGRCCLEVGKRGWPIRGGWFLGLFQMGPSLPPFPLPRAAPNCGAGLRQLLLRGLSLKASRNWFLPQAELPPEFQSSFGPQGGGLSQVESPAV